MITKCPHCPIVGDCLALSATCAAIEHDEAKRNLFIVIHGERTHRPIEEVMAEAHAEGIPESIEPRPGCCG